MLVLKAYELVEERGHLAIMGTHPVAKAYMQAIPSTSTLVQ